MLKSLGFPLVTLFFLVSFSPNWSFAQSDELHPDGVRATIDIGGQASSGSDEIQVRQLRGGFRMAEIAGTPIDIDHFLSPNTCPDFSDGSTAPGHLGGFAFDLSGAGRLMAGQAKDFVREVNPGLSEAVIDARIDRLKRSDSLNRLVGFYGYRFPESDGGQLTVYAKAGFDQVRLGAPELPGTRRAPIEQVLPRNLRSVRLADSVTTTQFGVGMNYETDEVNCKAELIAYADRDLFTMQDTLDDANRLANLTNDEYDNYDEILRAPDTVGVRTEFGDVDQAWSIAMGARVTDGGFSGLAGGAHARLPWFELPAGGLSPVLRYAGAASNEDRDGDGDGSTADAIFLQLPMRCGPVEITPSVGYEYEQDPILPDTFDVDRNYGDSWNVHTSFPLGRYFRCEIAAGARRNSSDQLDDWSYDAIVSLIGSR